MIVFNDGGYDIKRIGDPEEVINTIDEIMFMMGHLPDDYPIRNLWRITSLVQDMLPEADTLNKIYG